MVGVVKLNTFFEYVGLLSVSYFTLGQLGCVWKWLYLNTLWQLPGNVFICLFVFIFCYASLWIAFGCAGHHCFFKHCSMTFHSITYFECLASHTPCE